MLLQIIRNCTRFARSNNVINSNNVYSRRGLRGAPRSTGLPITENKTGQLKPTLQLDSSLAAQASEKDTVSELSTRQHNDNNNNTAQELTKTNFEPTFNLAAYINDSPTLKQLLLIGVNLESIQHRKGLAEFVLRLDFEKDIKPHLIFLHDQGVPAELYGELITRNPLIFKEQLEDLQTRVNYLEAKKFTEIQRQRIFTLNPHWLMFSTRRIDRRLGHFQQEFRLNGNNVRFLASKQPRLITYNMNHIRENTFCIREEMGFDNDELRCLLLSKPKLWMLKANDLIERFAYAHKHMKLSHDMLLQFPEVLVSREFRLRQRHEFLELLGRAQYDPKKDLYVSPRVVVSGNDEEFVQNVAKSDMKTYELFLRGR